METAPTKLTQIGKSPEMLDLLDFVSNLLFGQPLSIALNEGRCISCKQPVDLTKLTDLDVKKFKLSALCPTCFDKIMKEE